MSPASSPPYTVSMSTTPQCWQETHLFRFQQEFYWPQALGRWVTLLISWRSVCCSPWGCKESDTTERLNWTELGGVRDKKMMLRHTAHNLLSTLLLTFSVSSPCLSKTNTVYSLSHVSQWESKFYCLCMPWSLTLQPKQPIEVFLPNKYNTFPKRNLSE